MERLTEYIGNHPWFAAAAVVMAALVIAYELRMRTTNRASVSPQDAIQIMNQGALVLDIRPQARLRRRTSERCPADAPRPDPDGARVAEEAQGEASSGVLRQRRARCCRCSPARRAGIHEGGEPARRRRRVACGKPAACARLGARKPALVSGKGHHVRNGLVRILLRERAGCCNRREPQSRKSTSTPCRRLAPR